jgi:hypothetical protein
MSVEDILLCSAFPSNQPTKSGAMFQKFNSWYSRASIWPVDSTIEIGFVIGSDPRHMKKFEEMIMKNYAPHVGLKFSWIGTVQNADIMVGFNNKSVLESAIGSDSEFVRAEGCDKKCSLTVPGMVMDSILGGSNFYYGKPLHEFGHALGLLHEMQRPDASSGGLTFKEKEVIEDFIRQGARRAPWDSQENKNWYQSEFFPMAFYGSSATGSPEYDFGSIMTYSFGKNTNVQGKQAIEPKKLSSTDIKWLNTIYPKQNGNESTTTAGEPTTATGEPTPIGESTTTGVSNSTGESNPNGESNPTGGSTDTQETRDTSSNPPLDEFGLEWTLWITGSIVSGLVGIGLMSWFILRIMKGKKTILTSTGF